MRCLHLAAVAALLLGVSAPGKGATVTALPLANMLVIGCYQAPKGETLQALREAGFNLVRLPADPRALDEAQAAGLRACVYVGGNMDLSDKADERQAGLKATVDAVKGHPALLCYDGPDEPLYQIWGPGFFDLALPLDSPARLETAARCREQAARLAAGLTGGHDYVRTLDPAHPIWINHAPRHPEAMLAPLAGVADIHSFDFYPVPEGEGHSDLPNENLSAVGGYVDRLARAMGGRPVWAVLQGFSWTEIGIRDVRRTVDYPSFAQSRFLAYDAIAHGATGVLYWGTHTLRADNPCWISLKALAAELNALAPVLVAPAAGSPQVEVLSGWHSAALGARALLKQVNGETYLVLVNEERYPLDVQISGLPAGQNLDLLYTPRTQAVAADGSFTTTLEPYGVHVYAPNRRLEAVRPGRDFGGPIVW